MNERAETGPMQFGDDWRGLYIRGDNCMYYANCLQSILDTVEKGTETNAFFVCAIKGLLYDLKSSDHHSVGAPQQLKSFEECILNKAH